MKQEDTFLVLTFQRKAEIADRETKPHNCRRKQGHSGENYISLSEILRQSSDKGPSLLREHTPGPPCRPCPPQALGSRMTDYRIAGRYDVRRASLLKRKRSQTRTKYLYFLTLKYLSNPTIYPIRSQLSSCCRDQIVGGKVSSFGRLTVSEVDKMLLGICGHS